VLVGWSFGGYVVCDYLRVHGDSQIAGAQFVSWAVMMGDDPQAQSLIGPGFFDYFEDSTSDDLDVSIRAIRGFVRECTARELPPEEVETMVAFNSIVQPSVRRAMALCDPVDNTDVLSALTVPVLLSYGLEDRITLRAAAEYILSVCSTARASLYEGVGHSPFLEETERFNLELADFAARANRDRARLLGESRAT
jgi:pimeloyl-ACP methyl ester carboxylesterase